MDAALPRIRLVNALAAVGAADWDAVANPLGLPYDPFVSWEFLDAMERSGAATRAPAGGARIFWRRMRAGDCAGRCRSG